MFKNSKKGGDFVASAANKKPANKSKTTYKKRTTSQKNGKKATTAGNKTSNKKTTAKTTATKTTDQFDVSDDVKIIVSLVVMLLLFCSNFHWIGKFGDAISNVMFGLFGIFAYIIPIGIFVAVCFVLANMGNKPAMRKFYAVIVLYIAISTGLQMIHSVPNKVYKISDIYITCMKNRNGGGIVGGLFTALFCTTIGYVGAYIICIAVIILCIVIISEKSFVRSVQKKSRDAYDHAKEDMMRKRERNEERSRMKKQGKLKRVNNKVEGVVVGARVTDDDAEDVHEITGSDRIFRGHINENEISDFRNPYARNEVIKKKNPEQYTKDRDVQDRNTVNRNVSETIVPDVSAQGMESQTPSYQMNEIHINPEPDYQLQEESQIENIVDINKIWGSSRPANTFSNELSDEEKETQNQAAIQGDYTPKEKIIVSDSAKKVMKRKAFSVPETIPRPENRPEVKEISNNIQKPDTEQDTQKKGVGLETVVREKSNDYVMPPIELLNKGRGVRSNQQNTSGVISETGRKLQETLSAFGVKATVINESKGPSVTRYELQPETGTKVSKITALSDDIKLNLAASDIRIEAPIPGKAAVGIEVPNAKRESVLLRDLIESEELKKQTSKIAFAAGMDITGNVVTADIAKMPHMLIAGTTGSGKSVFTNSIIMSILFRAKPSEVRLIIVDPKVVEFGIYNGIPHLLTPVVTDPKKAAGALNWAVAEMGDRYSLFAKYNVRDLKGYNEKIKQMGYKDGDEVLTPKPQIVIIIDELADLMMVASKEVEAAICRLAQLARAAGIHLIIATQRPSVDVVTGLIKANIPSRVALLVSSGTDSRTIIDCNGGEKLLGNGDMLFYPSGYVKPVRLQGAFVSDEEVSKVVDFLIQSNQDVTYDENVTSAEVQSSENDAQGTSEESDKDVLYEQAARFVIEKDKGSTSMLQRMYKIGFNRAARIIDQLEQAGVVGPDQGTKPRKVLMTLEEFEETLNP